jgi:transposase-like protein
VAVLADGTKQLLALEMRGKSHKAWKGFLDDLVGRELRAALSCIVDGNPGLRQAVELVFPAPAVQCCVVHSAKSSPSTSRLWRGPFLRG